MNLLEEMINFGNVEHTAFWHAWYAAILEEAGHVDLAVSQFDEALNLEPNAWRILQCKSRCLVDLQKYGEARDALQMAIRNLPDADDSVKAELENDFLLMLLAKKDYKSALEYARGPYERHPHAAFLDEDGNWMEIPFRDITVNYIRCLFGIHDYPGIAKVIDDVGKFPYWKNPLAILLCIREIGFEIGCALQSQNLLSRIEGHVSGAVQLYKEGRAWQNLDFTGAPWFLLPLAEFMYHFYDDLGEAIELLEMIFQPWFQQKTVAQGNESWYRRLVEFSSDILPSIYYQNAVAAKKSNQSPDHWVNKLREFAVAKKPDPKGNPVYSLNKFSQTLGVYLRRYGGVEDSVWRACFRNSIIEALDMLGDEDPMNDITAYLKLLGQLLSAGDIKNASAAAEVVLMQSSFSSDPGALAALDAIGFRGDHFFCSGLCVNEDNRLNVYKADHKELHFCAECPGLCFCESCFALLTKGELPFRKCSPDHEFIQLFPVPEDTKGIAAKFDGKTMEVQKEWVNGLRQEWS